eukprot:CAMPEP_0114347072 /NCGR_PEP_ID=MMETSP0101-20121206/13588_1 /TAXON_ID=38822 ORGANISM="Pteridomonas danica, Strain PT" /NCGR_SAMPLE_ID=MMETSP0101 /ASSEMBLY_ACC=CAM_ASM_000211 /LENGTH=204 /DNA_ID=CAMNT_0001484123 /DNA_START=327 /DNA_END=941 /DNA_ORIENTATION=+
MNKHPSLTTCNNNNNKDDDEKNNDTSEEEEENNNNNNNEEDDEEARRLALEASKAADLAVEALKVAHEASLIAIKEEAEAMKTEKILIDNKLISILRSHEIEKTAYQKEIEKLKLKLFESNEKWEKLRILKEDAEANAETSNFLVMSLQGKIRNMAGADPKTFNDTYEEVLQEELSMMKAAYEAKLKGKDAQMEDLRGKLRRLR